MPKMKTPMIQEMSATSNNIENDNRWNKKRDENNEQEMTKMMTIMIEDKPCNI